MTGVGISGIASSVLRFIVRGSFPDSHEGHLIGLCVYFGIAAIFALSCVLTYRKLVSLEISKFYTAHIGRVRIF